MTLILLFLLVAANALHTTQIAMEKSEYGSGPSIDANYCDHVSTLTIDPNSYFWISDSACSSYTKHFSIRLSSPSQYRFHLFDSFNLQLFRDGLTATCENSGCDTFITGEMTFSTDVSNIATNYAFVIRNSNSYPITVQVSAAFNYHYLSYYSSCSSCTGMTNTVWCGSICTDGISAAWYSYCTCTATTYSECSNCNDGDPGSFDLFSVAVPVAVVVVVVIGFVIAIVRIVRKRAEKAARKAAKAEVPMVAISPPPATVTTMGQPVSYAGPTNLMPMGGQPMMSPGMGLPGGMVATPIGVLPGSQFSVPGGQYGMQPGDQFGVQPGQFGVGGVAAAPAGHAFGQPSLINTHDGGVPFGNPPPQQITITVNRAPPAPENRAMIDPMAGVPIQPQF